MAKMVKQPIKHTMGPAFMCQKLFSVAVVRTTGSPIMRFEVSLLALIYIFGNSFSPKELQMMKNYTLKVETAVATFWATFWKMGYFLFPNIWSHWLQHSATSFLFNILRLISIWMNVITILYGMIFYFVKYEV